MAGLNFHRRHSGFTIIELIVVIAVIAILAVIVILSYGAWRKGIMQTQVKNELIAAAATLESDRNTRNSYVSNVTTIYTPPAIINLAGGSENSGKGFCIYASSTEDPSVVYYLDDSLKAKGPQAGDCSSRPIPPTAPSSVVAGSVSDVQFQLTWGSVPAATSFIAQCATDQVFVVNSNQQTFSAGTTGTMTGLNPGTLYYCRVKAVNSYGTSAWTATTQVTTNAIGSPGSLVATTASTTQINLTWGSIASAINYTVQRSLTSGFDSVTESAPQSGTTLSITELTPGEQYYFRVKATNIVTLAVSGWSSTANAITTMSTVTGMAAGSQTTSTMPLSWTTNANATCYQVQRSQLADFSSGTASSTCMSSTTYTWASLTKDTTYYFRVRAMGDAGTYGSYSSSVNKKTYTDVLDPYVYSDYANELTIMLMSTNGSWALVMSPSLGGLFVSSAVAGVPDYITITAVASVSSGATNLRLKTFSTGELKLYNGTGAIVWTTGADQLARIAPASDGWYSALSNSGVLSLSDGTNTIWNTTAGIIVPSCQYINNYNLKVTNFGSSKVFQVAGASTANSANFQQNTYSAATHQIMNIKKIYDQSGYPAGSMGDAYWGIYATHSNKVAYIDENNLGTNNQPVQQISYGDFDYRRWNLQPYNGNCILRNSVAYYLQPLGNSTANAVNIVQNTARQTTNLFQQWVISLP